MNDFYVVRQRPSFMSELLRVFPLLANYRCIRPITLRIVLVSFHSSYSSRAAAFAQSKILLIFTVVRKVGLEPTRILLLKILSLVCLPISPLSHNYFFFCALFWLNQISFAFSGNLSGFAAFTFANELLVDFNASLISFIFCLSVTITGLSSIICFLIKTHWWAGFYGLLPVCLSCVSFIIVLGQSTLEFIYDCIMFNLVLPARPLLAILFSKFLYNILYYN